MVLAFPPLALPAARAESSPTVMAAAEGGVVLGGPPATRAGGSVALDVPISGRVGAWLDLGGGAELPLGPYVRGIGGARVRLAGGRFGDLSLLAGAGAGWSGRLGPLGRAGLGWEAPGASRTTLGLALLGEARERGGALVVQVGLVRRLSPPAPAPVAAAPTDEEPLLTVDAPDAMVWVPHPVCAWVPADELPALFPNAADLPPLQVRAPGYLPQEVSLDHPQHVVLQPVPPTGSVVVAAWRGDRVSIGAVEFPIGPDGTAVFGAREGPIEVTVTGSGRRVKLEGAVAPGYMLWLTAPKPDGLEVPFAAGSAVVARTYMGKLVEFSKTLGEAQLRVTGGTAEGEDSILAQQRAETLVAALIAAGVPEDAIKVVSNDPAGGAGGRAVARVDTILEPK